VTDERHPPDETEQPDTDNEIQVPAAPAETPARGLRKLPTPLAWALEFLIYLLVALLVVVLVRNFLIQNYDVPSGSMEQTVEIGDNIVAWKPGAPQRGEIVVFRDDHEWLPPLPPPSAWARGLAWLHIATPADEQYLVKRLIGLPGDHVVCCDVQGRVSVNGVALDETSYLYQIMPGRTVDPSAIAFDVVVPEGHIFVMGDHRNNSGDSRYHMCNGGRPTPDLAFPSVDAIQGRAFAVIMPPSRWRTFSIPDGFAAVPDPTGPAPAPWEVSWSCPLAPS